MTRGRTWLRAAVAAVACAGTLVGTQAPATADGTNGPLCLLVSNAHQFRDAPGVTYERTVHAWYQFRVHGIGYDNTGRLWYFGHSGESWWDDGWVLASHVAC